MRRPSLPFLLLPLLACASSGARSGGANAPAPPDRVVLVDERGRIYRSPVLRNEAEEQVVPGTMQQSVQALVAAYESLGLSVNTVDWTTGLVAARGLAAPRRIGGIVLGRYVDCGSTQVGQQRADSYAVTLNTESVVRPGETGRMVISTFMNGSARPRGVAGEPVPCATTRALERRIHLQVAKQLAGG
ncbi:MAG: hypothetical protein AVDCRST_MAG40-3488 [uncultured Gemmatimonadaceae bacterium]|uniref:DUF4410 domain-containing protein n=1 Tax=uncultured Gemmatimonadaceae bacterium TaxID=246130 RepID=A0A6J4MJ09_9BACT|nr:MAG: hypothetical protein AVDCRST_MAG40-3488 [uncultured Gemmatimonadaceae bacterium]